MITNGVNLLTDGQYSISVHVTDINVTRQFRVRGDTHIGGLMLTLAEDIDVNKDWSDHALWWPQQNRWLTHTRSTLDQCRMTHDALLEFTPMHKMAKVQMPDLQVISAKVNFSVPTFDAAVQLCRDLGIRYQEELSFKRYIPPEVLARGSENREFQPSPSGQPQQQGGRRPLSQSIQNLTAIPRNAPIVGQVAKSQKVPISASTTSLNRASSIPPGSTSGYNTLPNVNAPYGTKYATLSPKYNVLNNPGLMTTGIAWDAQLTPESMDERLINSPKDVAPAVVSGILRPRNYVEKAALNAGWLDSSRSLLEQAIVEDDFILLRFKYLSFFDLNPKIDQIRINQIYEQAKWSVLTEELDTTEAEAYNFAGLQLQAQLKAESKRRGEEEEDVNDVDNMITELENLLEGNWVAKHGTSSTESELSDYLQFFIPKRGTLQNWRRAFFVLQNMSIHWYNNAGDSRGPPMGRIYLRGAEISNDVSVAENKYNIKLMIPSQDGLNEFWLKCDTVNSIDACPSPTRKIRKEQRYAKWLAACQMASRGKTVSDGSYAGEVEMVHAMLSTQHPTAKPYSSKTSASSQDINPDDFLPSKFVRAYRGDQSTGQKVIDQQNRYAGLSLMDAKLQYIKAWQALREYGLHYFIVRIKGSRQAELLIITNNRMMLTNLQSDGAMKIWPFSRMKKWHVNWEIRHIFIQMDDEDIELECLSADCKVPHEFIGGYIFASTRSKDKNQNLNNQMFHQLTGGWQPNPHYYAKPEFMNN